jgi:hypothetical protein
MFQNTDKFLAPAWIQTPHHPAHSLFTIQTKLTPTPFENNTIKKNSVYIGMFWFQGMHTPIPMCLYEMAEKEYLTEFNCC